jgi:hypothetical protein
MSRRTQRNWKRVTGTLVVVLVLMSVATSPARAENWSLSGSVGGEIRAFPHAAQYPAQFSGAQSSLLLNPEIRYRSDNRRHLVRFAPNIRIDSRDSERSLVDITELTWTWNAGDWETVAGFDKVFWGVTESRHLVDIVNQSDFAEDIDGEEKLGQPMFSVAHQADWGRLDLYTLVGFRERTFPGREGRLRFPLPVDNDLAEYESGAKENHIDFAARYSHYLGDWDFGLSAFHGTSREPRLRFDETGTSLIPIYDQITQLGTDVQYTNAAWLWKFEGIVRMGDGEGQSNTFAATVAGFEYTLYQLNDSPLDIGLLVEYLYDGRDGDAPPTLYANDIFAGTRLALNDTQDTSLLAGMIVDVEDQSTVLSVEAERRLGDNWKLEAETRWFIGIDRDNLLNSVRDDSYLTLRLRRFF